MDLLPLFLFFIGFCVLICKRSVVDMICGIQLCFMGLLAYVALNGSTTMGIGFIILLCAALFGAIGMSVLYKSGFMNKEKT